MKRVLIVTHHFPPEVNGTATRVYEITRFLLKIDANTSILILAPVPSRPFGKFKQTFQFIRVRRMFNNRVAIFRIWNVQPQLTDPPAAHRILNYLLFPLIALVISVPLILISDIVIVVVPPTPLCTFAIAAKLFRKEVIMDVTDLWHEEAEHLGYISKRYRLLSLLSRGLELLAIKMSRLMTAASYTIAKYYAKLIPGKNTIVLPMPVDTSLVDRYCSNSSALDTKEDIVIYAGNFGRPQALHLALQAFAILKQNRASARLILIGGGEEEYRIRELVAKLGLDKHVEILSPVPRKMLFEKYYRKAKVGLVPLAFSKALVYAIPTKLYEYLACGLPFVSYGSSLELKHIALTSGAGIHVDKEDPAEIAKALGYVMDHYEQLSKSAKTYFTSLIKKIEYTLRMIIRLA